MSILKIFLFFLLLIAFLYLLLRLRNIFKAGNKKVPIDGCSNEEAILFAQRQQWLKAKSEMFGSTQVGNQADDFDFYKRTFGVVELMLGPNKKNLTSLVYYRIYKNANDNIRSLLLEYAYTIDHQEIDYQRQNCRNQTTCIHRRIHHLTPTAMKTLYFPSYHYRYAFTFTREPISRFLSAVTEIEYRIQETIRKKRKYPLLPFQYPIGSPLRFQEMIKLLLLSSGSSSLFRDYKEIEIVHLAPQIPTILLGQKVETIHDFHIYSLDSFNDYWEKISNQTKLKELQKIYLNRGQRDTQPHPSSLDPYHTTLAAKSFLSHSSLDAYHR
jgi:hypothetical protein